MSKVVKLSEKVKPLYTDILVSLITETPESASGIIIPDTAKQSMVSDVQKVMAKGDGATNVEVNEQVKLKMTNLMIMKSSMVTGKTSQKYDETEEKTLVLDPNRIHTIDGVDYLMIREGDIAYKVLGPNI